MTVSLFRFRTLLVVPVAMLTLFPVTSGSARGATTPRILLNPKVGPPTVPFTVRGEGFGAEEPVDISFDRSYLASVETSPDGTFTTTVRVRSQIAIPGRHRVTAIPQFGGERADAPYVVRTDWARYHFDNANTGFNPYEN